MESLQTFQAWKVETVIHPGPAGTSADAHRNSSRPHCLPVRRCLKLRDDLFCYLENLSRALPCRAQYCIALTDIVKHNFASMQFYTQLNLKRHRRCASKALRGIFSIALICLVTIDSKSAAAHSTNSRYLGLPPRQTKETSTALSARAILGMRLFFDRRLSGNGEVSCATCHIPTHGFTDGRPIAVGVEGQRGTRNTPTLWNSAYLARFFWDGRAGSLASQALSPLFNPRELGVRNPQVLVSIIRGDPTYRTAFQKAFGGGAAAISASEVGRALASYEGTLVAGDSPFDRYFYGHERHAISAAAIRGLGLFLGRANCASCHTVNKTYALFTDNTFHDEGIGLGPLAATLATTSMRITRTPTGELDRLISSDPVVAALGRFVITKDPSDIGKFRTPSLRNVALTAPYMHDGSIQTLSEAVELEIYYRGLRSGRPLLLTPTDRSDLVAFLNCLTSPAAFQSAVELKSQSPHRN